MKKSSVITMKGISCIAFWDKVESVLVPGDASGFLEYPPQVRGCDEPVIISSACLKQVFRVICQYIRPSDSGTGSGVNCKIRPGLEITRRGSVGIVAKHVGSRECMLTSHSIRDEKPMKREAEEN